MMTNPRTTDGYDRGTPEELQTGHGWVSEVEPDPRSADPRPV